MITDEQAKMRLGSHLPHFHRFFHDALDLYESDYSERVRSEHGASDFFSCIHCHVSATAAEYAAKFPDRDVCFRRIGNLAHIVIDNEIAVRFKKLNSRLEPSNNETSNSRQFLSSEESELLNASSLITLGYTVNDARTEIDSVHLISWTSPTRKNWVIEITRGAANTVVHELPLGHANEADIDSEQPSKIKTKDSKVVPLSRKKKDET